MRWVLRVLCLLVVGGFCGFFLFENGAGAQEAAAGQIRFTASSNAIKFSGVWVDGQYAGSIGELKNELRLSPGNHEISVRQAGFLDFNKTVAIQSGSTADIRVSMETDARFAFADPRTSAQVRIDVRPWKAAVFLDDYYAGTVEQFYGVEHAMLITPGQHRIKFARAGFQSSETEVNLASRQKFKLRTDLAPARTAYVDPLIRSPRATAGAAITEAR